MRTRIKTKKLKKIKKIIYLFFWGILGIILSFLIHSLVELMYLSWMEKEGRVVVFYGGCALKPFLQIGILIIGICGGFSMGCFWWQKIYIEKIRQKKKINQ